MADRALVAALVAGDPRGLEGAYRAYADRLYTYCRGLLHDADAAADVVHDTFVVASQRAGQLRDPDRLRPWLYAIARHECLRLLRGRSRHAPLEAAGQVSAAQPEPDIGLQADQVRELVWAAAAGLNPGDRHVFELSVQHQLAATEVAGALGVSTDHAHARLSRARAQLEKALGALLVARTGRQECARLAQVLGDWDGRLTPLVRKRVSRHIESCPTCEVRRREQLRPAALLSAYAGLPFLAVPAEVWPRLERTSFDPGQDPARQEIGRRAGRFDRGTGFPPSPERVDGRRRAVAGVAAAAVAVLLAVAGGATVPQLLATAEPDPVAAATPPLPAGPTPAPPAIPAPPPSPSPIPPLSSGPVLHSPTPPPSSPSPSPITPMPSPSPTPSPSPPPLTVDVTGEFTCEPTRAGYLLVVHAAASEPLTAAWLFLGTDAPPVQMEVDGNTASGQARWRESQLTWWVQVDSEGRSARSEPAEEVCRVPQ